MDFHSLTRKELQSLCKLNKIPANITNVAMADALQSLDIVEGIEKFIKVTQPKTTNLDESKENLEELSSPKVAKTKCRTTNRKNVKTTEPENLQPTETRPTRRTARKLAGGIEESKNDALVTPALSSTRRRALATTSCRNVNSQLNECEVVVIEDDKTVATKSRRKVGTTSTGVQKTYTTRRSTRQTEKKSEEPRERKDSEINSMLDEMNVASDEVSRVEASESSVNAGNENVEVEDICNAFEELVVVVEEKEDCGEVENLKPESDEISNVEDTKPEANGISNPCLEEEVFESEIVVMEEELDSIININSHTESGGDDEVIPCNSEKLNLGQQSMFCDVSEMNTEAPSELNSNSTPDVENRNEVLENMADVDEVEDVGVSSEKDMQQTPALSTTLSCRNDCEQEANEKKCSEPRVMKEYENTDLGLDEVNSNVTFQEVMPVQVVENAMDADAKMEDFEKLDEKEDADNLKLEYPCENGDLEEKHKVGENFDMGEEEDDDEILIPCEKSESFLDVNSEIESGSSTMVSDMTPKHSFNLDNDEKTEDDIEEAMGMHAIQQQVDGETLDVIEADFVENKLIHVAGGPTSSIKKFGSDDKENNSAVVFGNNNKKDKGAIVFEDLSLRQLRKQFKNLKLKTINANSQDAASKVVGATARPALQALCDNQLVGGQTNI